MIRSARLRKALLAITPAGVHCLSPLLRLVYSVSIMAPISPQSRNIPSDDELDDILNGIVEGRDVPPTNDSPTQTDRLNNKTSDVTGALGIDEEIVITKKRVPIPKLDDQRLLSDPGIPRLRKISKDRLRFKGKGHEACGTAPLSKLQLLTRM